MDQYFAVIMWKGPVNYSSRHSLLSDVFKLSSTSRKSLRSAHVYLYSWHTGIDDPLWLQESIWKAIGVFPNIRH